MAWLPAAFTVYFFIPTITLLTLWQTVPLLLAGRAVLKNGFQTARFAGPIIALMFVFFAASTGLAILFEGDKTRALIRASYYIGLFAIISFTYEMGRRPECYKFLLQGLVTTGVILSLYGLYQIFAASTGLPFRGIVRGDSASQIAYEAGILRINSLASEPKRLGYVLFVCALASFFYSRIHSRRKWLFNSIGAAIIFTSIFTFSGSYFAAIALFAGAAALLYLYQAWKYLIFATFVIGAVLSSFPSLGLTDAVQQGVERRMQEVEVGLDGQRVYRQEFFAWDYLSRHPMSSVYGVGLGQYFLVLNREYGTGVGISDNGTLRPLNSGFLELVFDFGGAATILFYSAICLLILRFRWEGEHFLCLALLFVTVQSFTIVTLHFIVLFAGVGTARLVRRRRHAANLKKKSAALKY